MKILANDGISKSGIITLEKNGFEVITTKVAQEQVANYINKNNIGGLLVKSATKVTKDLIDLCPDLQIIGCGTISMENIEADYARSKGIQVVGVSESFSESVAELVFAHLFTGARFLHDSNRNMPLEGDINFDVLKKSYTNGIELRGKTLGIIGFGKVGQKVAKIALGLGMKVMAADKFVNKAEVKVDFYNGQFINVEFITEPLEDVLKHSDFITVHTPLKKDYVIGKEEFELMKDNVGIINCASGGVIDEVALVEALDNEKVLFAGLDVFEMEPTPEIQILMHPKISLTPHIGASTYEAQERIGEELAKQIINVLKTKKV